MTSIIRTRADKARSIELVEQVLRQFVVQSLAPADAYAVMQHIIWLRRQTEDLKVNCRFETFPQTKTTRIVLDLSFAPEVKPFMVSK